MKFKDAYIILGTLCWLLSLVTFIKRWPRHYRWFSIFLFITVVTEWAAWWLKTHKQSNLWVYNLYSMLEFAFLPFFYTRLLHKNWLKKLIFIFIPLYLVAVIINVSYGQGLHIFNTYTYMPANFFMLLLAIMYYIQVMKAPTYTNIMASPDFFINTAYFLFFTIEIPITISLPYFMRTNMPTATNLVLILKILNALLYSFLIIAFLCPKKNVLSR